MLIIISVICWYLCSVHISQVLPLDPRSFCKTTFDTKNKFDSQEHCIYFSRKYYTKINGLLPRHEVSKTFRLLPPGKLGQLGQEPANWLPKPIYAQTFLPSFTINVLCLCVKQMKLFPMKIDLFSGQCLVNDLFIVYFLFLFVMAMAGGVMYD